MAQLICFFMRLSDNRDLHSFPTRRSSDLVLAPGEARLDLRPEVIKAIGREERSEEHTSELQSRPHLVCRLLLAKKKHNERASHCLGPAAVVRSKPCVLRQDHDRGAAASVG